MKTGRLQSEVAKTIGVSRPMIYNYEKNLVDFKFEVPDFKMSEQDAAHLLLMRKKITIRQLARVLNVSHTILYRKMKSNPQYILEKLENSGLHL
jgi:predicted DNA-binding transcriptional regulator AlpA